MNKWGAGEAQVTKAGRAAVLLALGALLSSCNRQSQPEGTLCEASDGLVRCSSGYTCTRRGGVQRCEAAVAPGPASAPCGAIMCEMSCVIEGGEPRCVAR